MRPRRKCEPISRTTSTASTSARRRARSINTSAKFAEQRAHAKQVIEKRLRDVHWSRAASSSSDLPASICRASRRCPPGEACRGRIPPKMACRLHSPPALFRWVARRSSALRRRAEQSSPTSADLRRIPPPPAQQTVSRRLVIGLLVIGVAGISVIAGDSSRLVQPSSANAGRRSGCCFAGDHPSNRPTWSSAHATTTPPPVPPPVEVAPVLVPAQPAQPGTEIAAPSPPRAPRQAPQTTHASHRAAPVASPKPTAILHGGRAARFRSGGVRW